MNVHSDMSLDTEGIINTFAIKHYRRMKFKNMLEDVEKLIMYLKLSYYFNGTQILAIFASTNLAYIHFSDFIKGYEALANTCI